MSVAVLAGDPYDEALIAQVHPRDWVNPTPAPWYNLVVLGAGTAGLVAAGGAAQLGARVALVEEDLMGGDCLNVGCVPSKALIHSARAAWALREAEAAGILVDRSAWRVEGRAVFERLRRLRASIAPHDSARRFADWGVDVFLGRGRFTGPDRLEVNGATLRFRRAVLATGAGPRPFEVPGADRVEILTNHTVFALTELPPRLVIVGGGPIGCELAQAFARLGSDVTLVGRGPRLLSRDDPEAADLVAAALRRDGVALRLGSRIERIESPNGLTKRLTIRHEHGDQTETIDAEAILAAVGRAPRVEGIGLEAAGVAFDPVRGAIVDDYLRTTNRAIFAAGDVASPDKFTHAAEAQARLVIRNALFAPWGLGMGRASRLVIPHCTYTDPEVAQVGLTEGEAIARGFKLRVLVHEFAEVDRSVVEDETAGFVKLIAAARGDRILGATIVGRHAGELVGTVTLALTKGLGLAALSRLIVPYPTRSDALRQAAGVAEQAFLFSPGVHRWTRRWLSWVRG